MFCLLCYKIALDIILIELILPDILDNEVGPETRNFVYLGIENLLFQESHFPTEECDICTFQIGYHTCSMDFSLFKK